MDDPKAKSEESSSDEADLDSKDDKIDKKADDQSVRDLVSDKEIKDIVGSEMISLNIPAILMILFGLFLLFIAALKLMLGWYLYNDNFDADLGYSNMIEGTGLMVLMFITYFAAYGLIVKKKYAPLIGTGLGIFFIAYFSYGVSAYRALAKEAESETVTFFSDITKPAYYETNMYASILLLLYVLILTFSMIYLLYKQGYLDKFLKRKHTPASEEHM
jgi:hypothetical protein